MKHSTFHNSIRDDVMYSKARLWPLSRNTWAAAAAAALPVPAASSVAPTITTCPSIRPLRPLPSSQRGPEGTRFLSPFLSLGVLFFPLPIPQFLLCQVSRIVSSSSYINTPSLQSAAILVTSFVRKFVCKFHMQFSSCSAAKQLYYGPPAWVTLTKKF